MVSVLFTLTSCDWCGRINECYVTLAVRLRIDLRSTRASNWRRVVLCAASGSCSDPSRAGPWPSQRHCSPESPLCERYTCRV